jgi:Rrf2 family protein
MRLMNRNTCYAVRTLNFMAKQPAEIISVDTIVGNLKIPRSFLRKILQVLNKKGILRSSRGKGGGFKLAIPPSKIYLIDLIEIFQGPNTRICPYSSTCEINPRIENIQKYIIAELKDINMENILKK